MENISGKFCPVCKFKNDVSASICAYCGAFLESVGQGERTTRRVDEEDTKVFTAQSGKINADGIIPPPKGIAIYLPDGTLVEIMEEKEFFMGRKFEESKEALVDLIPFGAFQLGVSRQHAIIRQTKRGYDIVDLNSTNGTFLNGNRLVSNRPYPLPRSSQVSLGHLHMLVLYARIATKDKTPDHETG